MTKDLSVGHLLQNSDRMYLSSCDQAMRWNSDVFANVTLLFRIVHTIPAYSFRHEVNSTLRKFSESFNNTHQTPFELDPKTTFKNWPLTPFEEWAGRVHDRWVIKLDIDGDNRTNNYNIIINVYGVIDTPDIAEYMHEYSQAKIMEKMAS